MFGKYGGFLLGAIGKNDNEGLFHVAFGIVHNETNENLTWFLATLGEVLYGDDDYDKVITFVSDKSKGLAKAVVKVFPSTPHGFCLRHFEANFMRVNARLGNSLREECWAIIIKTT